MDLNPDQMIAMQKIAPTSIHARIFDLFNQWTYRRADDIVVLDRFMAGRVLAKIDVAAKIRIIPPWPHDDKLEDIAHEANPFRKEFGLNGKFVVMYSGNHSPANPIATVLNAAARMQDDPRLVLMCIGGGSAKQDIDDRIAAGARNIISLPYQPFEKIRYSLSAADVHIVSVGNDVVGIVHPCKVYGAMAVSRPILLLGPSPCHVSEIIEQNRIGWHISHGDVDGAQRALREMLDTPASELRKMGQLSATVIAGSLSRTKLIRQFCDVLERARPGQATRG